MKKIKILFASLLIGLASTGAHAQGLGDILKGLGSGNTGEILNNVLEGVFSSSDITIADIAGSYVSEGPAVTFKSDNFLQKAGGIAGAATIESKLKPYYEQYGLTGLTLEIDKDANFTMNVKGVKLNGTITKNEGDGTFDFNLKAVGMNVGKFTAYIEKSMNTLAVMFDGKKLMQIVSTVAKFTGNSVASSLGSLLESYEGAYIGFKMSKTGNAPSDNSVDSPASSSSDSSSSSPGSNAVGGLLDLLNKKK